MKSENYRKHLHSPAAFTIKNMRRKESENAANKESAPIVNFMSSLPFQVFTGFAPRRQCTDKCA